MTYRKNGKFDTEETLTNLTNEFTRPLTNLTNEFTRQRFLLPIYTCRFAIIQKVKHRQSFHWSFFWRLENCQKFTPST
jgi:hypothetical protein